MAPPPPHRHTNVPLPVFERRHWWNRFLRYWVSHGPAFTALMLLCAHLFPRHAQFFADAAIVLASLMGGGGPPPILNGGGIGNLVGAPPLRTVTKEEKPSATDSRE